MTDVSPNDGANERSATRSAGAVFGMVFPTVVTLVYFLWASQFAVGVQQAIYAVGKTLQFVFPIVWVALLLRESIRPQRPRRDGIGLGLAFGLVVGVAAWFLYRDWLGETAAFAAAAEQIRGKILGLGVDSVWKYAALGLFYSLLHSLLEEYYWRWFVFGQLRRLVRLWPAILLSAVAFTAHHVLILGKFFGETPLLVVVLSSAVAVGGVFWAWLYQRSGSLYGAWLSHLLVDAAIFLIGYDLVRDQLLVVGP